MTREFALAGCRPEPLGSYLKALGVFRLVADQLDMAAMARWDGGHFVFTTEHDLDEVVAFLVDTYRPTPIVSPWNGGSGFYPKDNTDGITAIEGSTTDRLAVYREVVELTRRLVGDDRWAQLTKDERVTWCRNELPDAARPWIDTAVVLSDGGAVFPPILGTGGNVGRLDFSNNFMQRIVDVLVVRTARSAPTRDHSQAWSQAALTGTVADRLLKKAVGQFDPGAAGGTNAPAGGVEESLVNPWDLVLTFEGALLFASGAARRMSAGARGKAAMPFTFDTTPVGYPSAVDGENAKGELWAPLWSRPTGLSELRRLFSEGRMEWRGAHARRGIDAARSVASLGVDRGMTGFARHVFVERMGQAMLAVPVGQVATAERPREDVAVLGDLDDWVEQVRRATNLPVATATALRRLDAAMFAVTGGEDEQVLQDVLVAAAELERAVARSRTLRSQITGPLGVPNRRTFVSTGPMPFDAKRWMPLLDDGSPELRLAVAVASGRDPTATNGDAAASAGDRRDTPATLLRAVRATARGQHEWRPEGRPVVPGLGVVGLVELLGALVQRRAVDAQAQEVDASEAEVVPGQVGIDPSFAYGTPAHLDDVARFVAGDVDLDRLGRLIGALLLLRFHGQVSLTGPSERLNAAPPVPSAALVLPFFHGRSFTPARRDARPGRRPGFGRAGTPVRLRAGPQWPRLLGGGRVVDVVRDAVHRLRVARLDPRVEDARSIAAGVSGPRLLAAAAFRLTAGDVASLLARVAAPSTEQRLTTDPEGDT